MLLAVRISCYDALGEVWRIFKKQELLLAVAVPRSLQLMSRSVLPVNKLSIW